MYVGVVSPSEDATAAARTGSYDSIRVWDIPLLANVKIFSHEPSSGRIDVSITPAGVVCGPMPEENQD